MSFDDPFRAALLTSLLVVLPIGLYHRIRSQATGEPLDRRQEGWFILATLRPLGAVFWVSVIAWMVNPDWYAWSSLPLPPGFRWLGIALLAAAWALLLWTFRSLGANLTDTVVTRRAHTLVQHGPYRWLRHPLYTAAGLFTAAMFTGAANWFFLVIGAAVLALLVLRTRTEEANLVARFGDDYRAYMARTGRFWPRLGAGRGGAD